jgi:catechol 2,3-dioxygenase-like lactoylglutathione lyase family enzyme
MTRLTRIRPLLEVTDVEASIAFYTDVLGFSCNTSIGDAGERVWANLVKDDVMLMVNLMHTHDDEDEDGGDHGHDHAHEPALTGSLYFNVDDVDALALDLGGKVALEFGPEDQPHGMREIAIVDPDGYVLVFGMPLDQG